MPLSKCRFCGKKVPNPFRKGKILESLSDFYLEPQESGGFVAFSREFSGAIGQGETIEEAIADIQSAVMLLKEVINEDKQVSQEKLLPKKFRGVLRNE